jgi:hypothetical protein
MRLVPRIARRAWGFDGQRPGYRSRNRLPGKGAIPVGRLGVTATGLLLSRELVPRPSRRRQAASQSSANAEDSGEDLLHFDFPRLTENLLKALQSSSHLFQRDLRIAVAVKLRFHARPREMED